MKRKGLLIFFAASALSIAGAFGAFASSGWQQVNENGVMRWVYYNSYGDVERSAWAKSAAGEWYWLGSDGYMATNSLVDDGQYCVDENGRMVKNQWRQVSLDGELKWMYFGSNGKATADGWKQVSGSYYFFDDDGIMQTGWVDDNKYYCAENGVMKKGWQYLLPPEDYDEDYSAPGNSADGKYWFYFQDSGKVVRADDTNDDYVEKKIGDKRYCFDEIGIMQTGWVKVDDRDPAITGYRFCADTDNLSGFKYGEVLTSTWWSYEAPDGDEFDSADVNWYYLGRTGEPFAGKMTTDGNGNQVFTSGLEKISGKTYLFNEVGNPVTGLRKVKTSTGATSMYFGDERPSYAQTGSQRIDDGTGNKETYLFSSSGYGYTGVKDGKLYYMGKLQKAKGESRSFIRVDGTAWLVNSSGNVLKNKTYKDDGEIAYQSDGSGRRTGGYGDIYDAEEPEYMTD